MADRTINTVVNVCQQSLQSLMVHFPEVGFQYLSYVTLHLLFVFERDTVTCL